MRGLEGVSHVSLTVTDPERSAAFYNRVFGSETLFSSSGGAFSLVVVARQGMMIALRDHPGMTDQGFDPRRVGLDHIAFQVPSRAELETWHAALAAEGVACSPIEVSPFGLHLNLKDPDDIAIELFVSQPS